MKKSGCGEPIKILRGFPWTLTFTTRTPNYQDEEDEKKVLLVFLLRVK